MPTVPILSDPADNLGGRDGTRRRFSQKPIHPGNRVEPAPLEHLLAQSLIDRSIALFPRETLKKAPSVVIKDHIDSTAHSERSKGVWRVTNIRRWLFDTQAPDPDSLYPTLKLTLARFPMYIRRTMSGAP